MEASCHPVPLGLALCIRALVCVVVLVDILPGVREAGMRSGAGSYSPSTWLALESWGTQAARSGFIWMALWTEAPVGLLHHLWPLTPHHAGWSRVPYEVIDAEHPGLARTESRS